MTRSIRDESVSWGELADLQGLAAYIDPSDLELLEWAGASEFDPTCALCEFGEEPGHEH